MVYLVWFRLQTHQREHNWAVQKMGEQIKKWPPTIKIELDVALFLTIWTGMRYGLATLATSTKQLSDQLRKIDFESLSLLSINKHV